MWRMQRLLGMARASIHSEAMHWRCAALRAAQRRQSQARALCAAFGPLSRHSQSSGSRSISAAPSCTRSSAGCSCLAGRKRLVPKRARILASRASRPAAVSSPLLPSPSSSNSSRCAAASPGGAAPPPPCASCGLCCHSAGSGEREREAGCEGVRPSSGGAAAAAVQPGGSRCCRPAVPDSYIAVSRATEAQAGWGEATCGAHWGFAGGWASAALRTRLPAMGRIRNAGSREFRDGGEMRDGV